MGRSLQRNSTQPLVKAMKIRDVVVHLLLIELYPGLMITGERIMHAIVLQEVSGYVIVAVTESLILLESLKMVGFRRCCSSTP
jgi:hypothetical protein